MRSNFLQTDRPAKWLPIPLVVYTDRYNSIVCRPCKYVLSFLISYYLKTCLLVPNIMPLLKSPKNVFYLVIGVRTPDHL